MVVVCRKREKNDAPAWLLLVLRVLLTAGRAVPWQNQFPDMKHNVQLSCLLFVFAQKNDTHYTGYVTVLLLLTADQVSLHYFFLTWPNEKG